MIKTELQIFLDLKDTEDSESEGIEEPKTRKVSVVASNILSQEGKVEFNDGEKNGTEHSLIITLVNIEEEKNLKPPHRIEQITDEFLVKRNPEININLYVLFTAFSSHYETSLGIISDVIGFFQGKNLFNPSNTPSLDCKIEKIIADLRTLSFEQQNYLWSVMGAKYLPSVLYKLRMLSIDEEMIKDKVKPVKEIQISD